MHITIYWSKFVLPLTCLSYSFLESRSLAERGRGMPYRLNRRSIITFAYADDVLLALCKVVTGRREARLGSGAISITHPSGPSVCEVPS